MIYGENSRATNHCNKTVGGEVPSAIWKDREKIFSDQEKRDKYSYWVVRALHSRNGLSSDLKEWVDFEIIQGHVCGGMALGPSGSTSDWNSRSLCFRIDPQNRPPAVPSSISQSSWGAHPDSLFFPFLLPAAWPMSSQSLKEMSDVHTHSSPLAEPSIQQIQTLRLSFPAQAVPQTPRMHTQPLPFQKCLKKRWRTSLPGCSKLGWGGRVEHVI